MAVLTDQCLETTSSSFSKFDIETALKTNGWLPNCDSAKAEDLLLGKSPGTYLITSQRGIHKFELHFVNQQGMIIKDFFRLVDPIHGIWRNGHAKHVGKLEKVLCDMMECNPIHLKPFSPPIS